MSFSLKHQLNLAFHRHYLISVILGQGITARQQEAQADKKSPSSTKPEGRGEVVINLNERDGLAGQMNLILKAWLVFHQ